MRLFLIGLGLAVLFAAPLLVFGDTFDAALSGDAAAGRLRGYGAWAWAAGVGLIVADLVLPIPATAVMVAFGVVYGALTGGLLASAGSFAAGSIAYGATRMLGRRAALVLAGEKDLARSEQFFRRAGGYAVALTRPLPLLPEVIACLAGLSGMPAPAFFASLAVGATGTGFTFAAVGALGIDRPALAVALGCIIPLAMWPIAQRLIAGRPSKS